MSYRDERSALEARRDQLREDLDEVRRQLPQANILARREREIASELASVEASLAGKPARGRRRAWVLASVAVAVVATSGAAWLALRLRAQAAVPVPIAAPQAPPRPDCRVLTPQEVLRHHAEPGLVAERRLIGGPGFNARLKVYDDHRVAMMVHGRTLSSTVLKDDTTQQLVALAGSLGPDVSPPVSNCPPDHADSLWKGDLFHGRGALAPTEAERAKIARLMDVLESKFWVGYGDKARP